MRRPHSSDGWSELPVALFDRVCSYVSSPVYDTLLKLSTVCRQWQQLLDGDGNGRYDCWRHAPTMYLGPQGYSLVVSPDHRTVKPPHFASALWSLRRIRSLRIGLTDVTLATGTTFFDLLFPHVPESSSTHSSTHVRLEHLRIDSRKWMGRPVGKPLKPVVSSFLLRTPPLRAAAFSMPLGPFVTTAALRHMAGSGRLLHFEVRAEELSSMVWGDRRDVTQPSGDYGETTEPWRGASTIESLVLTSTFRPSFHAAPDKCFETLEALPSLTHLSLVVKDYWDDARPCLAPHHNDRLTFLRLRLEVQLPPPLVLTCSALQSLSLTMHSGAQPGVLRVLDCLHMLPQLNELAIQDNRNTTGHESSLVLPPLPATLTYLQLSSRFKVSVMSQPAGTTTVELHTALPPSLLCLSLALPEQEIIDAPLTSIPPRCSHLTHCHVGISAQRPQLIQGFVAQVPTPAAWMQRVEVLKAQLGAGVWCDNGSIVEQQRMDKRWQRETGVHTVAS